MSRPAAAVFVVMTAKAWTKGVVTSCSSDAGVHLGRLFSAVLMVRVSNLGIPSGHSSAVGITSGIYMTSLCYNSFESIS